MNLNPKYLIYHDLIGLDSYAKLKSSSHKKDFSDIGIVIDESKNMLITNKNTIVNKYIKKDHIFKFRIPEKEDMLFEVNGSKIVGRPENRLRSLRRKRWK